MIRQRCAPPVTAIRVRRAVAHRSPYRQRAYVRYYLSGGGAARRTSTTRIQISICRASDYKRLTTVGLDPGHPRDQLSSAVRDPSAMKTTPVKKGFVRAP